MAAGAWPRRLTHGQRRRVWGRIVHGVRGRRLDVRKGALAWCGLRLWVRARARAGVGARARVGARVIEGALALGEARGSRGRCTWLGLGLGLGLELGTGLGLRIDRPRVVVRVRVRSEAGVPLSMGSGRSYLPGPVATLFSAVHRTARRGTRCGWLELPTSCSPPGCNLPGTTRGPS
eukprot:scaffold17368_cov44-Phaeocystis_antarctica.AAC.2